MLIESISSRELGVDAVVFSPLFGGGADWLFFSNLLRISDANFADLGSDGSSTLCRAGIPLCSIACSSVGRDIIDVWNVVGMDGVVLPVDEGTDELTSSTPLLNISTILSNFDCFSSVPDPVGDAASVYASHPFL